MKDITRYTYLNLETRPDRRLLATCTAFRDGIPEDLIHFWQGDASFETWDEIGRHAVEEHGFENFEPCIGQQKPLLGTVIGQMFNIACYLTDRVKRKDTLEVFLHDDTYFANSLITQAHARLNYLCWMLQKHKVLNMLLLNPEYPGPVMNIFNRTEPEPFREQDIYLGDCVLDGIKGACDFGIVFSTKGAEMLLEQMLKTPPWRGVEVILSDKNWCPDGIFTTAFPFVKRYPLRLVKSDNFAEDPNFIETPEMRL